MNDFVYKTAYESPLGHGWLTLSLVKYVSEICDFSAIFTEFGF